MKRRQFIILTGVGATGTTLLSACGHPENKLIPALIPDDEYVPGVDYWKATTCAMCEAGCGIVVRTREHKANKIEGNPLHPINRGALCARGQAGLQSLYNPDRIRHPLKRVGERGSGEFAEITWDEAIKTLADRLREIKAQGREGSTAFVTGDPASVTAHTAARFMQAYGSTKAVRGPALAGPPASGIFDIANATYLLSFGARFLETWQSPVMYSLAYGEFRRSAGKARGKFVQVEPRMSLTGANADEWLPAPAGSEALVALALAQALIHEGKLKKSPSTELLTALENYAPEKVAGQLGIPADKLARIAREFGESERPLAICGSSDGHSLRWVDFLNQLVDNTNKRGGVLVSGSDDFDPFEKLRSRTGVQAGPTQPPYSSDFADNISALMVHHFNPVHTAPFAADKIKAIPFIASFSSFRDETTELADLILPDHTYLESWGLTRSRTTAEGVSISLTQPVVKPEFNSRQTADVLILLSREMGGDVAASIPFASAEEMVKQLAADLPKSAAPTGAESPDDFWKGFTERGVWVGNPQTTLKAENKPAPSSMPAAEELSQAAPFVTAQAAADEFPFALVTYEHAALGFGEQANLPWLQELPDPMTTVMWGSWVEINPKTAASIGVADGDLVEVTTRHGSARAPAVLYPAIRPDTIAMPCGQGHTAYGRFAKGRGANAALLSGGESAARAKVTKATGEARLIRFGTDLLEHMERKR